MPLTEEGNYVHEEEGFTCNGCESFFHEDDEEVIDGVAYCKHCAEEYTNHDPKEDMHDRFDPGQDN